MAPSKPSLKSVKPAPLPDQRTDDLAAARRVLTYASEALAALSASLGADFSRAIDLLMAAQKNSKTARVIVSGMGKSGHIARKIAATLSSTGSPAYFVHPTEASHGDMGAITRQDVLLMLSKGGETAELSDLITYAKRYRVPMIAIASNAGSTLATAADVALILPPAPEACPMGMAPTTSTTMMLGLGDAIAVALMERKNFSADQYRDFHPGGSLGRALIRVRDLMHQGDAIPLARENASMRDVLIAMAKGRLGCVGIVDGAGGLCGIITNGDLSRHMDSENFLARSAASMMTKNPKIAHPEQLAAEALAFMNEKAITQLFVIAPDDGKASGKKPLGVIQIHDCLRAGVA